MNLSGKARGEKDVPAGISNVLPCLSIIWERLLISMAAAVILSFRIMKMKLPRPRDARIASLSITGCTTDLLLSIPKK